MSTPALFVVVKVWKQMSHKSWFIMQQNDMQPVKKKKETKQTTVRQILMYSRYYTILVTQSKEYMGLYRYRGQF